MNAKRVLALLALFAAPSAIARAPADTPPPQPTLESIRVQLYYELSGSLSANIAPPATFSGWNTVIGEGDAKEAAQDVLVSVHLTGNGVDAFLTETPLVITARNGAGKVIGTRSINGVLVPYQGTVSNVLWLQNATCVGKLNIEARFGKMVKKTAVNLDCGE